MNRVSIDGHSSFAHNLREARVSVYSHPHLLRCPLDQLGEDALGDKVRDLRSYGVHAKQEVGLRVGDHLHEAVGFALD